MPCSWGDVTNGLPEGLNLYQWIEWRHAGINAIYADDTKVSIMLWRDHKEAAKRFR